jgi:hypothetical protein
MFLVRRFHFFGRLQRAAPRLIRVKHHLPLRV